MPRFSPQSLEFIALASRQKNPGWLEKNRARYEQVLVEPMRELMTRVAQDLRAEAPGYRFPTRGFARIKRSSDRAKAQGWFKDWIGTGVSRDSGSLYEDLPSLYFHLSPAAQDVFSAGGLYMPSSRQTKQIRAWIAQDAQAMEALFEDRAFRARFKELGTERVLKTKPRDYPVDHPKIEWLKLMGWYVWRPIPRKELYSRDFSGILAEDWRQVLKLNRVLDGYLKAWPSAERPGLKSWIEGLEGIRAPQADWS